MSDNAPSTEELLTRARSVLSSCLSDTPDDLQKTARRSVIERLIVDIEIRQAFDAARKAAL